MKNKTVTTFICSVELICAFLLLAKSITGDTDTMQHLMMLIVMGNLIIIRVLSMIRDKLDCIPYLKDKEE